MSASQTALSAYEEQRLRNIQANEVKLKQLGLFTKKKTKKKKKKKCGTKVPIIARDAYNTRKQKHKTMQSCTEDTTDILKQCDRILEEKQKRISTSKPKCAKANVTKEVWFVLTNQRPSSHHFNNDIHDNHGFMTQLMDTALSRLGAQVVIWSSAFPTQPINMVKCTDEAIIESVSRSRNTPVNARWDVAVPACDDQLWFAPFVSEASIDTPFCISTTNPLAFHLNYYVQMGNIYFVRTRLRKKQQAAPPPTPPVVYVNNDRLLMENLLQIHHHPSWLTVRDEQCNPQHFASDFVDKYKSMWSMWGEKEADLSARKHQIHYNMEKSKPVTMCALCWKECTITKFGQLHKHDCRG